MGEQRAQDFQHYPQHSRAKEGENEQKNQNNSGVDEKLNHHQNPFLKESLNHQKAYHA